MGSRVDEQEQAEACRKESKGTSFGIIYSILRPSAYNAAHPTEEKDKF